MIAYILLFFCIVLVGFFKVRDKNKICSLIIFLFMGFRYDVGWDYRWYFEFAEQNYLLKESIFATLKNLSGNDINLFQYLRLEILNKLIYKIVWLLESPQVVFLIYSALLIFFLKKGLEEQRKNSIFPWLCFLGIPLFFFNFLSLMRQAVAVAIIFYSYKFIIKRKILKFLLCVILASLFHKTALFFIITYYFYGIKIKLKYLTLIMISSFFSLDFLKLILKLPLFSSYRVYIDTAIGGGGGILYWGIASLGILLLGIYHKLIKINKQNIFLININLIGIYMYISLFKLGHLGPRMAIYFLIYLLYIVDDIILVFKQKKMIQTSIIIINFMLILILLYTDLSNPIRSQYQPYKINFFNRGIEWKKI